MGTYEVMKCNPTNVGDWQKIEAESARQAAEIVCHGSNLRTEGKPGELRVRVRLVRHLQATVETDFYADL
jgi:hypothetical protein